jgi:crossover junction endodeoxyribonuclease RuvC
LSPKDRNPPEARGPSPSAAHGTGLTPQGQPPAGRAARPYPVVLGIDPGTQVLGYGAVVAAPRPRLLAAGEVRAGGRLAVPERLGTIRRELDALLARLDPDVVVVEQAFASRNVQSALRMGEARGVVLSCVVAHGARVAQITPAEAKKTLVGNGAADKRQVARMVAILLDRDDLPERLDVTDALAIALAWLQRERAPRPARRELGASSFEQLVARLAPARRSRPANLPADPTAPRDQAPPLRASRRTQ